MTPVRVLVAGHDAGGLNLLAPLLAAWVDEPSIDACFAGAAAARRDLAMRVPNLKIAAGAEKVTEWLCHQPGGGLDAVASNLLAQMPYDVVLCATSALVAFERRLHTAAQSAGIPSIAFCDMWAYYIERFREGERWYLPDRLWAVDGMMKSEAAKIEWPRPLPIDVVGSPLFSTLMQRRGGAAHGRAIRFISEPVSTRFPEARLDEVALAELLLAAVRSSKVDLPIAIRPHPAESQETWRRWCFARRAYGVSMDVLPLDEAIADTALAVGISSILLGEMRMCGVPAASLQPPDADASYFCLPFEDLGIARVEGADRLCAWLAAPGDGRPPAGADVHARAVETATRLLIDLQLQSKRGAVA